MSLVKSGFAPVNGLQMYFEIHGRSEAHKPLILIHGGGSTIQSNWTNLIPFLETSRQVIAVDMQAHGRTADIDRDFTFEQDADDIAALIRYFNFQKADVFGFSNGGQSTMLVAARHPQVVNKIIVASSAYTREGFIAGFWDGMAAATLGNMPQALKDAYLAVNPSEEGLLKMFRRDATRMLQFKSWNDDLLRSIKAPALIINGDQDVITNEHVLQIHRLIKGSRLAILPANHGSYLGEISAGQYNPKTVEGFANMVLAFLDN